jgi:hypothetical protein
MIFSACRVKMISSASLRHRAAPWLILPDFTQAAFAATLWAALPGERLANHPAASARQIILIRN